MPPGAAPPSALIVPPAALRSVPFVTVNCELYAIATTTVSSIAPLFVNPLATVRLARLALPSTCPIRSTDPTVVVNAPVIADAPDATSVP